MHHKTWYRVRLNTWFVSWFSEIFLQILWFHLYSTLYLYVLFNYIKVRLKIIVIQLIQRPIKKLCTEKYSFRIRWSEVHQWFTAGRKSSPPLYGSNHSDFTVKFAGNSRWDAPIFFLILFVKWHATVHHSLMTVSLPFIK